MEDIALRFSLARQLMAMKYGDVRGIASGVVQRAWPPTGDHDRSIEGAIRAMALSNGGNRPEESYTTQERIERDLDDSFHVEQLPMDGSWKIARMLSACPKCHGRGFFETWGESTVEFTVEMVPADATMTVNRSVCTHEPD